MTTYNPEVDSKAPLCTGQDDELKTAMQSLRKPRQVAPVNEAAPKKARAKTKKSNKVKKPKTQNVVLTLEGDVDDEAMSKVDITSQLTVMETKFLELKFAGGLSTDKAMITAGYGSYSQRQRFRIAAKIVSKYESAVDDHRKIMRAMGYGETKIIEMLIDSAEKASSEMVKLTARIALAKCMGLQKEVVEVQHGMNIIIKSRSQQPAVEPVPGGTRPALIHQVEHKLGPKTISITT